MERVQQSIEVNVPVHTVYDQLTQFEAYPRFMQNLESVHQIDDTHLHWSANPAQGMEWDAEITEQLPDRCIAWHNTTGPANAGKVELQPVGPQTTRVTMTLECDPIQFAPARAGTADAALAQRLEQDLVRFKTFIESRGRQADASIPASAFAAGSEGFSGDEDPSQPVMSAARKAATEASQVRSSDPTTLSIKEGKKKDAAEKKIAAKHKNIMPPTE